MQLSEPHKSAKEVRVDFNLEWQQEIFEIDYAIQVNVAVCASGA
jgi:hypothetical protein